MTIFWFIAACLLVAALLFVLPSLLRQQEGANAAELEHEQLNLSVLRNQLAELDQDLANKVITAEQHQRNRTETERRILEEVDLGKQKPVAQDASMSARATALGLGLALPLGAVIIYKILGNPTAIEPQSVAAIAQQAQKSQKAQQTPPADGDHPDTGQQIENMVKQLEERLAQDPSSAEGWLMLGRSYRYLKRHQDAANAFDKAMPLVQGNSQLMADVADTFAMANDGNLEGKPMELINQALDLDPRNVQALWLKGTYQYEKGDLAGALVSWRRLQQIVPPGSEEFQSMANNIAEIETKMRQAGAAIPQAEAPLPAAALSTVSGRVDIAPELKDKLAPTDIVFIFARAATGPKMPLAILRKPASELPIDFQLDETMAMMPGMSLANYQDIVIGARVSKAGNAVPQSGDLEGLVNSVRVGAQGLTVTINRVVP